MNGEEQGHFFNISLLYGDKGGDDGGGVKIRQDLLEPEDDEQVEGARNHFYEVIREAKANISALQQRHDEGQRADLQSVLHGIGGDKEFDRDRDIKLECDSTFALTGHRKYDQDRHFKDLHQKQEQHEQPKVASLFGRRVHLELFTAETALYPVCRNWIQSDIIETMVKHKARQPKPNSIASFSDIDVMSHLGLSLPPPDPLPVDENGNPICLRIPQQQHIENEPSLLDYAAYGGQVVPASETELFRQHWERWVSIRQQWKQAQKLNDSRYRESFELLNSHYMPGPVVPVKIEEQ